MQKARLFAALSICFVPKDGINAAKYRARCHFSPLISRNNPMRE